MADVAGLGVFSRSPGIAVRLVVVRCVGVSSSKGRHVGKGRRSRHESLMELNPSYQIYQDHPV